MRCYLIRHGMTEGNTKRCFNGCRTDEPLTAEGRDALKTIEGIPDGAVLFSSPMKRALETAAIMFPDKEPVIIDDLREMDFGIFEGKNHSMLDGDPEYQAWLDSGGRMRVPGGESIADVVERSGKALARAVSEAEKRGADTICIVAHGGLFMALMSSLTGEDALKFNPPNGAGFIVELETDDAGNVTSATSYDRFLGGLRDGSSGWRSPEYTPPGSLDR
ncbi:MAG: histidine phosphatase family protein [Mogibacterium sp.]|nr:histidine phosphatase family protein [Mogibacterium sp.]